MKNFLFFINHVENSISKTFVYYFIIIISCATTFFIGATGNLIENRGSMEIKNVNGTNYQNINQSNTDTNSISGTESSDNVYSDKSVIFASVKGKYFYYKGCGGDTIAKKNLRYYKSESEAIKAGKKLYKNCE